MRSNVSTTDEFEPILNYPVERKARSGKNFPWTTDPIGRYVKTALGLWGDQRCGMSVEAERNFKAQGVGADACLWFIKTQFPEFSFYYKEVRGVPLSKGIAGDRYHKQYYDNKAPREQRGRRSQEHYLHDPKLRPLFPSVDARLKLGTPITLVEIAKTVTEIDSRNKS